MDKQEDILEGTSIVKLFLEKLEKLTTEERLVIIDTIKWLNKPIFQTK